MARRPKADATNERTTHGVNDRSTASLAGAAAAAAAVRVMAGRRVDTRETQARPTIDMPIITNVF